MDRETYSRLMYGIAYACATAILVLSYLGFSKENTIFISVAIACLVAAGWLSLKKDEPHKS